MDWNFLFVNTLNGIIYGSFLALISLGLSLVFGLGRVVNFAHGVLYALGAYFFILLLPGMGWTAMVAAPLVVVPIAIAMERLTIFPIRGRPEIYTLLVTFGLSFMITGAIEYLWGTEPPQDHRQERVDNDAHAHFRVDGEDGRADRARKRSQARRTPKDDRQQPLRIDAQGFGHLTVVCDGAYPEPNWCELDEAKNEPCDNQR